MMMNVNSDGNATKPLQILTLNVNGLHSDSKRRGIFQNIINKNVQIIFLLETHSNPETSKKWEKEWKGKSIWHSGIVLKSSGVAILFQ